MEGADGDGKTSSAPAGHGSIVTKPTPFRPQPGGPGSQAEMSHHQPLDGMFSSSMFLSGAGDLAFLHQSFCGFDFRMDSPGGTFGGLTPFSNAMDMGGADCGLMAGPSPSAAQVEAAATQMPADASRSVEDMSAQEQQQQQQQQEEPRMLTRSGINHAKPPLSVRPPMPGGGGGSFAERMLARAANKNNALAAAGRQATARFKAMPPSAITMPGPRTTSGNYLTIPPGLSPTTLLDSPVLLPSLQAEPSPTTGTYSLPPHYNGSVSASAAAILMNAPSEVKPEPDSSLGFVFKPIPKTLAAPLAQSLAPSMKAEPESAEASVSPADPTTASGAEETAAVTEEGDEDVRGRGRAAAATSQVRDFVGSDDGYNWRKYGQKQVKGCAQPRSYYKCTHPHCPVKKKVERSVDGTLIENVVKGVHIHPKPVQSRSAQLLQSAESREARDRDAASGGSWAGFQAVSQREGAAELADSPEAMGRAGRFEAGGCGGGEGEVGKGYRPGRYGGGSARLTPPSSPSSVGDELSGAAHTPPLTEEAEDDELEPDIKRRKGEGGQRTLREPRVVVMTKSNVDILDDGYRWRKYGQKTVKGNPHPRSYYKCTYPDCGVRKHVERASHDSKSVMTTYEGKHNHELPAARTGAAALAVVGQTENKASESGGWAPDGSPEPALEEEEDQNQVGRSHRGWGSLGGMLEDCVGGGVMRGDDGLLRRRLRVAGEGSLSALLSSDGLDGSMHMSQGLPTRGLTSQHLQEGGSGYALRSATMDGNTSSVYGSIGGGGSSSAFRPGSTSKVLPR